MDKERRKQLIEAYKNRQTEMGVISYRCKVTGESFLGISKDTRVDFNSTNVKLNSGYHPNKRLLELWKQYGAEGFECCVLRVLKCENPIEDSKEKLEQLREQCFAENPKARRIWK